MTVKLLTNHHLEFLSFKGGCTGSSDSTLVKMPHCWKSHVGAHFIFWYIVRSYLPIVIPELVVNKDLKTVQEIAAALDRDWKEMLRDCIPKILVHILPLFAASKLGETGEDEQVKRRTSKATACYDLLTREISKEVFWARHEIVILTTYGPRHEKT